MEIIIGLATVLLFCGLAGIIASRIGQPPLVGYLFGGLVLGILGIGFHDVGELAEPLAEMGIVFLLFIAGMEVKLSGLKKSGIVPFIIGGGQIIFTVLFGYFIVSSLLGFGLKASLFVAIALTLSSTIVVVKSLDSRKEMDAPHGQILMVTMVLQDLLAMLSIALFDPKIMEAGGNVLSGIGKTFLNLAITFIILYVLGRVIVNWILPKIAQSFELIFVGGLVWCFFGVLLADTIDFSIEMGAFLAGMAIAEYDYTFEIEDKIKPFRDFGLLLFFAFVGLEAEIVPAAIIDIKFIIILLFVMFSAPIIIAVMASIFRYPKKVNFFTAILPGQASEFSIILLTFGVLWGIIEAETLGLIAAVTIVSIIISSTIIGRIDDIFDKLAPFLKILEWRGFVDVEDKLTLENHAIILGFSDIKAKKALNLFAKKGLTTVVVDWDVNRLKDAKDNGAKTFLGNGYDSDVWDHINLKKAKLVLSTIENTLDGDIRLVEWLSDESKIPFLLCETNTDSVVALLNNVGFDYICFPDRDAWDRLEEKLIAYISAGSPNNMPT